VQFLIAGAIFANFLLEAVHKQINPEPDSPSDHTFQHFELFFAIVFGLELCFNIYAHWLMPFLQRWARASARQQFPARARTCTDARRGVCIHERARHVRRGRVRSHSCRARAELTNCRVTAAAVSSLLDPAPC
jgi:hypothetical protein